MEGILSLLSTVIGLGLLAAAMPQHWQQMPARIAARPRPAAALRIAGTAALLVSLALCVIGGSATIGALVWVMELALSASIVAAILAARSSDSSMR